MCNVIGIVMEFIVEESCNIVDNNNDMARVRAKKEKRVCIALRQGSRYFNSYFNLYETFA